MQLINSDDVIDEIPNVRSDLGYIPLLLHITNCWNQAV